jgi:hypothetical protein
MANELGLPGKHWSEKTLEECACGICDRDMAGPGAQSVIDPDFGLVVACSDCLAEVRRREARSAHFDRRRARRRLG